MGKKEEKEEIYVDMAFEYLLTYLYGKSKYHGTVGWKDMSDWKGYILKIFTAIEKGIVYNIDGTDNFQNTELLELSSQTKDVISKSKSLNSINQNAILGLTKLMFTLLGGLPDHWDLYVVNNPKHWKSDRFRTLQYSQNLRQKANLILRLANKREFNEGLPPMEIIEQKHNIEFRCNEKKFVDWFKDTYPRNYINIFLK